MRSSELIRCKECGQSFDTVESLTEHMNSEKDEIENRNKGLSNGYNSLEKKYHLQTLISLCLMFYFSLNIIKSKFSCMWVGIIGYVWFKADAFIIANFI